MKRRNTILLLATLAVAPNLVACDGGESQEEAGKAAEPAAGKDPKRAPTVVATRVEVATIQPTTATLRLVRPGEVEPSRDANLASATGGLIESIKVEVGDQVKSGQLIAKVDSSLMGAQASLARVEVDDAERELERLQSMGSAVAKVRLDQAETRVARAKAQARVASIQSGRTYVKAPFAGLVSTVPLERGEFTPPGGVIARVIQLDPAVVSVSVADRDVGTLSEGGTASVTTGGLARPTIGKISRIDPAADLRTRSFVVEVEVPNPDGKLRPGMIATVDFQSETTSEQIIVPQDLLVTKLEDNGVFVVEDDSVARWRPLVLGAVLQDQVVVLEGLSPGETVVSVGHRGLVDGDPLLIARRGACCTQGRIVYDDEAKVARGGQAAAAPSEGDTEPSPNEGEEESEAKQ